MKLPHCLICGAQKAGTRALIDYLSQHKNTYCHPYEIDYFSKYYHKGTAWYAKHFTNAKENDVIIEKSPSYMYAPHTSQKIKETIPDVKLIFMVRDPIKRAYSHYWMNVRRGKEHRSFSEAIRNSPEQPEECIHNYISRGYYEKQIGWYKEQFPKEQILILNSTDLRNNTQETLDKVCDFLQLKKQTFETIAGKKGTMPKSRLLSFLLSTKIMNQKQFKPILVTRNILMGLNNGDSYPPIKEADKKYLEAIYEKQC
jgi:hypothetical protein